LLLAKRVLELGLDEGGDEGQLEVDDVLLEALRVPQGDANALAIDLCFKVLGGEGRVLADGGGWRRGRVGPLLLGQREGGAQEVNEGGLAAALGANDEDAVQC
jgi:hypothetical protein